MNHRFYCAHSLYTISLIKKQAGEVNKIESELINIDKKKTMEAMMKHLLWIVMSLFLMGCVFSTTPGEIAVIEYNSSRSHALIKNTDTTRMQVLENELNNIKKRGLEVNYSLLSISMNQRVKDVFIMKETETEISSFKEITFGDIHESVNYLISEINDGEKIDYSQSLDLFRNHLYDYVASKDILLLNVGKSSFFGQETKDDTFSMVVAYDRIHHNVLLIEVNGNKQTKYWVHYKNLFDTAMTRRNQYHCSSGWLELKKIRYSKFQKNDKLQAHK
ncbi:hypothetical protein PQO03_01385 [Lentisphaera profundi]|uniref:Glutathione gamma-glutamylcysteinyltransferase n=1 Tax=Lentisphaera profundi TaxID=1658616 RepID=A0ABY7VQY6_9BACT|nr:hypothetical protein [Lentisphaera profundi]WDE96620.1 hypothetical protein PQO03_01385 [Lentisphaera profundi]